jgi:hypothetical protein
MIFAKTKTLAIAAVTLAGLASTGVMAQGVPDFATVDADQNGGASLAEVQAY